MNKDFVHLCEQAPFSDLAYHYCSMEALLGILESKTFRLSNVRYLNDSQEMYWLFQRALEVINDLKRDREIFTRPSVPEFFIALEEMLTSHQHPTWPSVFYCGCFSLVPDLLSQWRAYAADGTGVAIGFRRTFLEEVKHPQTLIRNIDYDVAQQKLSIRNAIEEGLDRLNSELNRPRVPGESVTAASLACLEELHALAAFAKNPAFLEEQEIRIRYMRIHVQGQEPMSDLEFRERNGKLIPYYSLPIFDDLGTCAIARIVLGPRNHVNENASAIMSLTARTGIPFAWDQLFTSAASYR